MNAPTHLSTKRHPWLAVFLSVMMPGLGQLYCGAIGKCLGLLAVFGVAGLLGLLALIPNLRLSEGCFLVIEAASLVVFVIGVVDAYFTARRTREDYKLKDYNRWYIYVLFYLAVTGGHLFALLHVRDSLAEPFSPGSPSMYPSLWQGDRLMAVKNAYLTKDPAVGDVVIFHNPENRAQLYIKRVVALGGESIEIRDGEIYVNEIKLKREAAPAPATVPEQIQASGRYYSEWNGDAKYPIFMSDQADPRRRNFPRTIVPDHACFVLGDNRDNSLDSRSYGAIPIVGIVGKADFVYQPLQRFGRVR
jgi:signal peptidase I